MIWRSLLYGGVCHTEESVIWRSLSYRGVCRTEAFIEPGGCGTKELTRLMITLED